MKFWIIFGKDYDKLIPLGIVENEEIINYFKEKGGYVIKEIDTVENTISTTYSERG